LIVNYILSFKIIIFYILDKNDTIIINSNDYSLIKELIVVEEMTHIILLSCGWNFCVCVSKNGVFGWGDNEFGQIGNGIFNKNYTTFQQIGFFKNPKEIISISCGGEFCICVSKKGVFSWGENSYGQLGIGNHKHQSYPQPIEFFKNPDDIITLSCGFDFCMCIYKDGIFSWGDNSVGQLGIGNKNQSAHHSPQRIEFFKNTKEIISLSCGGHFCMCVCKNGLFGWGENYFGQLGTEIFNWYSTIQSIPFFQNSEYIISVSCGYQFCICVCKIGVYSWGCNSYGQLGIGNYDEQHYPKPITYFKKPEEIISLSCGDTFCVCIYENEVFGWGNNMTGQLGIKNEYKISYPRSIQFKEKGVSYSDLSFPRSSIDRTIYIKKLLLISAREYLDPDEYLMGRYYLPRDMFNILLNFI
jgi:alpha-tubulin suppressor-like RCC1 family protein